jgi:RNA polymerase sigma-70 factor, ECF subfamily
LVFFSKDKTQKGMEIERMINEYGNDVLRTAYMYLKDKQRAEDAFQEVFIKAFKNYDNFRGDCSEKTWIIKITMNVCKDTIKGFWSKRVVLEDEIILSNMDKCVEEEVIGNLEKETLFKRVLELPPAYKSVIILYYYHSYSTIEIGKILSVPDGTVRSRLSRGREILKRQIIEGSGGIEQLG